MKRSLLWLLLALPACEAPDIPTTLEGPGGVYEVVIEGGTNVVPDDFDSVSAALADAAVRQVRHVLVREGVYDELPLRITHSAVELVGEGDVEIRAVMAGQPLLHIASGTDRVRVDGIRLVHDSPLGGAAVVSSGVVTLENVEISAPSGTGVHVSGGDLCLEGSTVQHHAVGVHATGGGRVDIKRSHVQDGDLGVVIEGGTNLRLLHSVVRDHRQVSDNHGSLHMQHVTISDVEVGVHTASGGASNLMRVAIQGATDPFVCDGTTELHETYSDQDDACVDDLHVLPDLLLDDELRPTLQSPLVDAGGLTDAPELLEDISGARRPTDGNFDGIPGSDIGAWELDLATCPSWELVSSHPEVGAWTEAFHATPSQSCNGTPGTGAVWRSRAVMAWADRAHLEFLLADGATAPSVDVQWWVLDATVAPSCASLDQMEVIATGTLGAGAQTLRVDVDPWSSDDAQPVVRRRLLLATGTAAHPHTPTWYAPYSVELRRSCQ